MRLMPCFGSTESTRMSRRPKSISRTTAGDVPDSLPRSVNPDGVAGMPETPSGFTDRGSESGTSPAVVLEMLFGRLLILVLSVLPKHGMSRIAGYLANLPVPRALRAAVYRGYARVFGAKLDEVELPLS